MNMCYNLLYTSIEIPINRNGIVNKCMVDIWRDEMSRRWILQFNDEILNASPEGLHAILGLALMELQNRV